MNRSTPLAFQFLCSGEQVSHLPPEGPPEIAIVGRSNVGKSSLLNYLSGSQNLARVSRTPGRTQLINVFSCQNDVFRILDLPGYGFAVSARETQRKWQHMMENLFTQRQSLVGVLFLLDVRRDVVEEDIALAKWIQDLGIGILLIQTKCDKVTKSQWPLVKLKQSRSMLLTPEACISTSSEKKMGLKEVFEGIAGLIASQDPKTFQQN